MKFSPRPTDSQLAADLAAQLTGIQESVQRAQDHLEAFTGRTELAPGNLADVDVALRLLRQVTGE